MNSVLKFLGTNLRNKRTKRSGQHGFWKKNRKNLIFSHFFQINHTFSVWKLHVDIAQKLQNLKVLLIFRKFLIDFNFHQFFWRFLEIFSEKGPNELELMSAFGKTWFLSKFLYGNLLSHMVSWQDTPQSWQASPTSVWLGLRGMLTAAKA